MEDGRFAVVVGNCSRRGALRAGGVAFAAALGAALRGAVAQDATPAAVGEEGRLLFVQSFGVGALAPNAGDDGAYTLTLSDGVGRTLYFTERPKREAGIVSTEEFIAALTRASDDPPNAALVADPVDRVSEEPAPETIWVMTLLDGAYGAETGELTYAVRILDPTVAETTHFVVAPEAAPTKRQVLGAGYLFIDDIDIFVAPYEKGKPIHST
jgi:hypothetical protein